MADTPTPLVDVKLDDGQRLLLKDRSEVEAFLAREQEFWQEASQGAFDDPFNQIQGRLNDVRNLLRQPPAQAGDLTQVRATILNTYANGNAAFPVSSSKRAQAILSIAKSASHEAARTAASMAFGSSARFQQPSTAESFRGAISYLLLMAGISQKGVTVAREAFDKAVADASLGLAADRIAAETFLRENTAVLEGLRQTYEMRVNSEVARLQSDYAAKSEELAKQLNEIGVASSASIASIKATEAAYTEQMGLQAPVSYWETRAKHYEDLARTMSIIVALFLSILVIVGLVLFACFGPGIEAGLEAAKDSPGVALAAVGAVAILVSIPLWGARILVRLYLSAHHLAQDARERMTMTETYLALTKESAAGEKDRNIILSALFRNTQDGVVKDPAGPDASLGGIISKLLDRGPA